MMNEQIHETDVLVVGGGMAGLFASIKAKEQGLDVILVDKGYVGNAGQSPYAGTFSVFDEEKGDDIDEWLNFASIAGEYLCNLEFTRRDFEDSKDRLNDLLAWGIEFERDETGELLRMRGGEGPPPSAGEEPLIKPQGRPENILATNFMVPFKSTKKLRQVTLQKGVKIIDRMMIAELLTNDNNKVIGALGLTVDDAQLNVFNAKAVIFCTGASSFKPNGWPISALTSDGDAMAYKLGAEIVGKEFQDPHPGPCDNAAYQMYSKRLDGKPYFGTMKNAGGNRKPGRDMLFNDIDFIVHEGDGPMHLHTPKLDAPQKMTGGATVGMGVHKSEGIWPKSVNCDTQIEGLYAAGDALGTMNLGAVYSGIGVALMGSATTGARAGVAAAKYAKTIEREEPKAEQLETLKKQIYEPLERASGFSPRWATQLLHNTMVPYFVLYIKAGRRLEGALSTIEFMRDHILPKLVANDAHELRLAIEVKHMVLNAEMKLKASLERKESRGCHYREDFPKRSNDFLTWITIKNNNGEMQLLKKPIPDEWKPDLNKSYEEIYPYLFQPEYD
jgi:succinate dehydrogenase/fumarate reductase flavoprotein subunit